MSIIILIEYASILGVVFVSSCVRLSTTLMVLICRTEQGGDIVITPY